MTGSAWLQSNIGLTGEGPARAGVAHDLFARLVPAVDELVATGQVKGWFFQRKPPDIRLRVAVPEAPASGATASPEVSAAIEAILHDGAEAGLVREMFWSGYEAEVVRFGGSPAMDVAHAHFCADSRLWFEIDRSRRAPAGADADPIAVRRQIDVLFTATTSELVNAIFPDAAGQDLVWSSLGRLTSDPTIKPRELVAPGERHGLHATTRRWQGEDADRIGALAVEIRRQTDRSLRALDPSMNRHQLVALLIHFDANRWGVDGTGQRWMAETFCRAPTGPTDLAP